MSFNINNISLRLYADGADIVAISELNKNPLVSGFTTNPTLMKKAGITDYLAFAKEVVALVSPKPVSLEVFADDFENMRRQALLISEIGENVYVKIPITNTKQDSSIPLIADLAKSGVKLNVTAIFTDRQVEETVSALSGGPASVVSVFAGRIADAGVDPVPAMARYSEITKAEKDMELLWASPREILNLIQASETGCDIITMTPDLWGKISSLGKSLDQFSLESVQMFDTDAKASGFVL
jgi:transaldolase